MGATAGQALTKKLISSLGVTQVSIQGVGHTATMQSTASSGSQDGCVMVKMADDQLGRCPNSKVAISEFLLGDFCAAGDSACETGSVAITAAAHLGTLQMQA